MALPQIVIAGRPNVGKSSLFNWLIGRRVAIVDDQPGVTRDRLTRIINEQDRYFELVDTGGIGMVDTDDLTAEIEHQIETGISLADALLFTVDARVGPHAFDQEIAARLRRFDKPILCVVNKVDSPSQEGMAREFHILGFDHLVDVSTKANRNRDAVLTWLVDHFPAVDPDTSVDDPEMKIAIVGRRNVGKSTFVNSLVHEDRMIVSEVPGTTRDSVDVRFEMDGRAFVAIDTPGLRKSKSVRTDIEFYGLTRARESVRRSDVVLMFFDASEPISRVDKQLVGYIEEHYRPCIFVVNKWDLYHGSVDSEEWVKYLRDEFRTMQHVPIAFVTGKTGKNIHRLVNLSQRLFKQSRQRVTTGVLNSLLQSALDRNPPPLYRQRRPKVFFASQIDVQPPTVAVVCNYPEGFPATYRRYLLGTLRDELEFDEVPIRLFFQSRRERDDAK